MCAYFQCSLQDFAIGGYILDVFHPSQHVLKCLCVSVRKLGAEGVVLPNKEDIAVIRGAAPTLLAQTTYSEKLC